MIETEILIVGGGIAGATLAKYLSLSNIPTILLQKKCNFKKPCGGGIRLDAFEEFDLDKNLIVSQIDTIVLASHKKRIEVDISKTPLGIVERRAFDKYLRQEAKKAGTTIYEAKFLDVEIQKDCVIATVKFNDTIKKIKAKYLVGADGVHSVVRKKVYHENVSSLMTNYSDFSHTYTTKCEFHFGLDIANRYYAWAFPESGGTNVGTLANQNYMQNFLSHLNIKEKAKIYGYKIPEFKNPIFYKNRVFFVGDSASQVLPFTYEGIYYAMSSAKILADVICNNEEPLMYEKRWNAKYLHKFTTLKKLQKIFLYNDFTIDIMMKLYTYPSVQRQMIELWLGKKELHLNFQFFLKVLKKILH
ncbi:Geranylgeranyl diphosphate reductase [hydrothermal vent metagenome]|uniref:Geranylgeranyl diphosphate reductase n=1 Tax=hydrothermal vent metagenome TaxID=652676 RepID=A0A1W1D2C5_9ZZZZ